MIAEFSRANPQLDQDTMAISCGGAGSRLKEIRFCFSKDGKPRSCGQNEDQRRMCGSNRMFIPPARSTARDDEPGIRTQSPSGYDGYKPQIPRPRVIESLGSQ